MNIKTLGIQRQRGHIKNSTPRYYKDKNKEDIIGVAGEVAFGKRYNLKPDLEIRPNGDGHIDFEIEINKTKNVTIDIKTAQKAYNLLVKKWEINKCSDILVLAKYYDNESIEFLGWTTKKTMKQQPIKVFSSLGIENYYLPKEKLRSMKELDYLFEKAQIRQIFPVDINGKIH
jgi:hypothetical protein